MSLLALEAGLSATLVAVPLTMFLYMFFRNHSEAVLCMECQQCLATCPVLTTHRDYAGPFSVMRAAKSGKSETLVKAGIQYCAACAACVERCPRDLEVDEHTRLIIREEMEEVLARSSINHLAKIPSLKIKRIYESVIRRFERIDLPWEYLSRIHKLRESFNPFDERFPKPNPAEQLEEVLEGLKNLEAELPFEKEPPKLRAEVEVEIPKRIIVFEGCTASRILKELRVSTLVLLEKLRRTGVIESYRVIPNERCCGYPSLAMGDFKTYRENLLFNLRAFDRLGAKDILFVCGACIAFMSRSEEFRRRGFRAISITELVHALVLSGKLEAIVDRHLRKGLKLTGHHACHLRRLLGIKLERIYPKFVEALGGSWVQMKNAEECCGSGSEGEVATTIAKRKVENAEASGAKLCLLPCAGCERILGAVGKQQKSRIRFVSLPALVAVCCSDYEAVARSLAQIFA